MPPRLPVPAAFAQGDVYAQLNGDQLGDLSDWNPFSSGTNVDVPEDDPGSRLAESPPSPKQSSSPAKVAEYAGYLRKLGYSAPDTGNAYDADLMAAVAAYQRTKGVTADGLVGPTFYRLVDADIRGGGGAPLAVGPSPSPQPGLVPVVATDSKRSTILLVAGAAAAVGAALLLFGGKKKRR